MPFISQALKNIRKQNGMTQKELADKLNVSQNAIYNWENGKREPKIDTIKKICDIFDVPFYCFISPTSGFIDEMVHESTILYINTFSNRMPHDFSERLHEIYANNIGLNPTEIAKKLVDSYKEDGQLAAGVDNRKTLEAEDTQPDSEATGCLYKTITQSKLSYLFNQLNECGKNKAIEQIELLTRIPEYRKKEPDE